MEVVVVDAGDADHQHGGDDQAGVVHGEAQQQSVHGTRHRGSNQSVDRIKRLDLVCVCFVKMKNEDEQSPSLVCLSWKLL